MRLKIGIIKPEENQAETDFSFDCNIAKSHDGNGSKRSEEQQAAERLASLKR
jgi:hypothetical protein